MWSFGNCAKLSGFEQILCGPLHVKLVRSPDKCMYLAFDSQDGNGLQLKKLGKPFQA